MHAYRTAKQQLNIQNVIKNRATLLIIRNTIMHTNPIKPTLIQTDYSFFTPSINNNRSKNVYEDSIAFFLHTRLISFISI